MPDDLEYLKGLELSDEEREYFRITDKLLSMNLMDQLMVLHYFCGQHIGCSDLCADLRESIEWVEKWRASSI